MTPKELKNSAPKLYELQKLNHGFDIPKGYFETVEKTVPSSLFLDSLDNQNAFITPENYLDSVESTVIGQIENQNASIPESYFSTIEDTVFKKIQNKPKVISIKGNLVRKFTPFAVAASILLILTLQFFNTTTTDHFSSIDSLEIEQWIDTGEINVEAYEIASIYNTINIESITFDSKYQDDELLDYLNEIDIESIILTN